MLNMNTALTALRASQLSLSIVGHNIANANTPGYHRQDVRLQDAKPILLGNHFIGQGVEISHIKRSYDEVTESALLRNVSEQGFVETKLQASREIESLLTPGQGTVLDRLETLFNDLQRLTADPDNTATRAVVVGSAKGLADSINNLTRSLDDLTARIDLAISNKLVFIHDNTRELVNLNQQIREAEIRGLSPNDLLDRRDGLIAELAKVIDVKLVTQTTQTEDATIDETVISLGDGQLQLLRSPLELLTRVAPDGQRLIFREGLDRNVEITDGELGALLASRNQLLNDYRGKLDEFTQGLVEGFDKIHVNGIGVKGSFDLLVGQRQLDNLNLPLSELDTVLPIKSGSLYITVVAPNGERTLHEITVDAKADTLQDVATRISALANVEARVDDPPGQFSIRAETGYKFDFLTTEPTLLDTSSMTGTVQPSVSGQYEGKKNDEFTLEFEDAGTVGVTPNLFLTVRDSLGAVVGEFSVGEGYEPGTDLELNNGVRIQLTPGDVNAGDNFRVSLLHESDTTNLLAATGMNTLFTGHSTLTLGVREDLLRDPDLFAMTLSGDPLDARNAEALLDLRYDQFMTDGTETLEENLTDVVSQIGVEVSDLQDAQETLQVVGQTLRADRDAVSGVDPNEEAVKMLQFQRSFQAAARYIVTIDAMLEELVNLVR